MGKAHSNQTQRWQYGGWPEARGSHTLSCQVRDLALGFGSQFPVPSTHPSQLSVPLNPFPPGWQQQLCVCWRSCRGTVVGFVDLGGFTVLGAGQGPSWKPRVQNSHHREGEAGDGQGQDGFGSCSGPDTKEATLQAKCRALTWPGFKGG